MVPKAFTRKAAAKLTGVREDRLRVWAADGFFPPQFESGLYSFRDLVGLRTLRILRDDRGVSRQQLQRFGEWLRKRHDQPWTMLRFGTIENEVVFLDDDGRPVSGVKPGQYADVVPFPIEKVQAALEIEASRASERGQDTKGEVARRRGVMGHERCVSGTRIPTRTLWDYHKAGYDTEAIIQEFPELTAEDVEAAIDAERRDNAA